MSIWMFFESIWQSFISDLKPADQVLALFPIAGYSIGIFAWIRHTYRGRNKNLSIELLEEKQSAQKWLRLHNGLALELEAERQQNPANWAAIATSSAAEGDVIKSFAILRDQLATSAPAISTACIKLANYHLSVWSQLGPAHLVEARRLFNLSALHTGKSSSAEQMLGEIDFLIQNQTDVKPEKFDNWDDLYSSFAHPDDVKVQVAELNRRTIQLLHEKQIATAAALINHSVSLSEALGAADVSEAISARYWKAQTLHAMRRDDEANELLDAIIEDQAAVGWEANDKRVVATRDLKVQVLDALGRYAEALAECETLDSSTGEVTGRSGRTMHLKAWVLVNNALFERAEVELQRISPLIGDIYLAGSEPRVLIVDFLRRKIELKQTAKDLREFNEVST